MTYLPEPPAAHAAGQAVNPLTDSVISAAVNDALQKTFHRDDTPVPTIGDTPPVAQPGRPPMSQRATDISGVMLAGSVASVPLGGMTCLVLYTLNQVDPVSLTIGASAPVALVLAASVLLRRAKGVLPDEHHHHYNGPVHQDQRNVRTKTSGVWAKTNNQQ